MAEAFEKSGLSAEEYYATINKMGALFKGSGFTEMEALEKASNAMQRAADVASVMGIDVDTAMESIAGAAKGNFTINIIVRYNCEAVVIAGERYQRCAA